MRQKKGKIYHLKSNFFYIITLEACVKDKTLFPYSLNYFAFKGGKIKF